MDNTKTVMDGFLAQNKILLAVVFFAVIVLIIILTTVFRRKCPQCGKYRAGELVKSQRAESTLLGGTNKVDVTLRCRFCGHEWQATEVRERKRGHSSRPPTPEEARAKIEQIDQALADPSYKVNASVRNAMIASRDNLKKYL